MNRKLKFTVLQWLSLEREDREAEAETALAAAFALLPEEAVPRDFAERVLARAGLTRTLAQPTVAVWGLRVAVSLCLLLTALFLLVIPTYLPAIMGIFHPGRITELAISTMVGVVQQLGVGLVIWRTISTAGSAVSSALSSPPLLAALAFGALVSFGALRVLHEVFVSERSSRYVGPA